MSTNEIWSLFLFVIFTYFMEIYADVVQGACGCRYPILGLVFISLAKHNRH